MTGSPIFSVNFTNRKNHAGSGTRNMIVSGFSWIFSICEIYWKYKTAGHLVFWKPWPAVEFSFCGWSHIERSRSWPVSGILISKLFLVIYLWFCFLQDLYQMRCSLSIFFGFGSRIRTFIWWVCTVKNSLYSSRVQERLLNNLFYLCYLSVEWFRTT